MDNACYLRNCSLLSPMAPKVKNLCQIPVTVEEDLDACMCTFPISFYSSPIIGLV